MKPRVGMKELEAIVRSRVCSVCAERTAEGICGLPEDPNHCSLFELFPLVAQAILATESEDIESYLRAIHENVCAVCVDQALDGSCPRRGQGCALDAHLPQIVSAIGEAIGRPLQPLPEFRS